MARSNTGSSSNSMHVGSAVLTARPLTLACWFKAGSTTAGSDLVGVHSGSAYVYLIFDGANGYSRGAGAVVLDGVGASPGTSTKITDTTTWHHCCGTVDSSGSGTVYLDGGGASSGSTITPSSVTDFYVGIYPPTFSPMNGAIAEVAAWSADLTAAEIASLAEGIPPPLVRPGSLAGYWPLYGRSSPEPDLWRGRGLSITGTMAQADHPRIYGRGSLAIARPGGGAPPPSFSPYWVTRGHILGVGVY